jgi:hypothetical protein
MSNKTQLQTNNTALDGYIARINAAKEVAAGLPEAGGGGGGSVETCTVELTFSSTNINDICYTTFNNNQVEYKIDSPRKTNVTVILNNVICSTSIVLKKNSIMLFGSSINGTAEITHYASYGEVIVIKAPTVPNEHCTVVIRDDD